MIAMRVSRLAMDGAGETNVIVLQEVGGERMLPIWIGRPEAEAIARFLEQRPIERPMTHDLARLLVESLGGVVESVRITHVQDSTFHAELVVRQGSTEHVVDARPSDAIAIGLRCRAPLYASEELLAYYPELLDPPSSTDADPEAPGDEPGFAVDEPNDDDPASSDEPFRSSAAKPEPSDLQRYLEHLRPEDLGKFRP